MKQRRPRLVTLGGGSGQSTVLRYLKQYRCDLTSIVSMVDDGGSTGRLRRQLNVLPPGDIRQCLVALAQDNTMARALFEYRFQEGQLRGHALGNLILAGLELTSGDFALAVRRVSQWLHVQGRVLPITLTPTTLHARLRDGRIVSGETHIDIPQRPRRSPIQSVYLRPAARATAAVLRVIRQADYIIFTIGDLYTSVIPNLLIGDITAALKRSHAQLIYTCNRTIKVGETDQFTALDYVTTIEQYLHRPLDMVVVDRTIQHDHTTPRLVHYTTAALQQHGLTVIETDLRDPHDPSAISGKRLAAIIAKLCLPSS